MDKFSKEMKPLLSDVLSSGKNGDVILSVDGKDFHVHKFILMIRSPVFEAMFNHKDTKEAQQGRVVIEDVSNEEFEAFLKHVYLCESPQKELVNEQMLMLADKVCFIIWCSRNFVFDAFISFSTKWNH